MPITQPKGKKIKMAQGHLKWDENELIDEKTGCKKSRETVPLIQYIVPESCLEYVIQYLKRICTSYLHAYTSKI